MAHSDDTDYHFQNTVFYWLVQLDIRYADRFAEALRLEKMTAAKWRALSIIRGLDGLTISELARQSGVKRTNLWHLLDGMEREGLIRRQERAADRRVTEVFMTEFGYQTFARLWPIKRRIFQEAIKDVDPAKVDILVEVVKAMIRNLDSMGDADRLNVSERTAAE